MILKPIPINTIKMNERAAQLRAVRFDKGSSGNYPHNLPFKPLLNLILNIEKKVNKRSLNNGEITMTHGALNGLLLSLSVLCKSQDKVLVNEIAYEGIFTVLKTLSLKYVSCDYKDKKSLETVTKKYRPKVLILNSPENPSGYIYSKEELKTIGHYSKKYNLHVVSDEVNNQNIYPPYIYIPPCKYIPKNNLISLNSFSKNYFMPELRLGWITGPKKVIKKISTLISSMEVGLSEIPQIKAYYYLKSKKSEVNNKRKLLNEKKNLCEKLLGNKVEYLKPIMSGSVVFINCKVNGRKFADKLLSSKNIALIPGILFGPKWKTWIRLGFSGVTKEEIKKHLPIILQAIEKS